MPSPTTDTVFDIHLRREKYSAGFTMSKILEYGIEVKIISILFVDLTISLCFSARSTFNNEQQQQRQQQKQQQQLSRRHPRTWTQRLKRSGISMPLGLFTPHHQRRSRRECCMNCNSSLRRLRVVSLLRIEHNRLSLLFLLSFSTSQ